MPLPKSTEVKPGVYAVVIFGGLLLIFAVLHFKVEVAA